MLNNYEDYMVYKYDINNENELKELLKLIESCNDEWDDDYYVDLIDEQTMDECIEQFNEMLEDGILDKAVIKYEWCGDTLVVIDEI